MAIALKMGKVRHIKKFKGNPERLVWRARRYIRRVGVSKASGIERRTVFENY